MTTSKQALRGPDGKFLVPFTLPEWLIRKVVLEVGAAEKAHNRKAKDR